MDQNTGVPGTSKTLNVAGMIKWGICGLVPGLFFVQIFGLIALALFIFTFGFIGAKSRRKEERKLYIDGLMVNQPVRAWLYKIARFLVFIIILFFIFIDVLMIFIGGALHVARARGTVNYIRQEYVQESAVNNVPKMYFEKRGSYEGLCDDFKFREFLVKTTNKNIFSSNGADSTYSCADFDKSWKVAVNITEHYDVYGELVIEKSTGNSEEIYFIPLNEAVRLIFGKVKPTVNGKTVGLLPESATNNGNNITPAIVVSTTSSTLISDIANKTADFSRMIKCNPKSFAPEYKPCEYDMLPIDIERETKAFEILKGIKTQDQGLKYLKDSSLKTLFVSDKQYQVIAVNDAPGFAYIILDLLNKKITDYLRLRGSEIVQIDDKKIIFALDGVGLKQYIYGTEKSVVVENSDLYEPQTYFNGYSSESGSGNFKIFATSTNSITLGVYDSSQKTEHPEVYWTEFKFIGKKDLKL